MAKNVLTDKLAEPLNGVTTARLDIHVGDGNLTMDRLNTGEQVLASGTLQYFEDQGVPKRTLDLRHGQATFTLRAGRAGRPWFHFPWSACNGATEWQIYLNPAVSSDITAHTDGGNVKLNLSGMDVTCLEADTGGGNMEVLLPEDAANLSASARTGGGNVKVEIGSRITGNNILDAASGAGNVEVHIPGSVAARIHATTGLGKAIVDPRFTSLGKGMYQSCDFDSASNRVEVTLSSGAGNLIVNTK